jgi:PAS domain S-box-containing protein
MSNQTDLLYTFLAASPAAALVVGADGQIVYANPRCQSLTGRTPAELVGLPAASLLPAPFATFSQACATSPNGGEPAAVLIRRADGCEIPVQAVTAPLNSPAGPLWVITLLNRAASPSADAHGFLERAQELENRLEIARMRESQMAESETLFRGLVENAPDAMLVTGLEGEIFQANERVAHLLGFLSAAELTGKSIFAYFETRDVDPFNRTLGQASMRRTGFQCELGLLRKDGRRQSVDASVSMAFDRAGSPFALMFVLRLTNARLQAHARANAELLKLSRALDHSPAAVVILDPNGKVEYTNSRYQQMTGFSDAEIRGKDTTLLITSPDSTDVFTQMRDSLIDGVVWRGEFTDLRKDGSAYWVLASISPVQDEHGQVVNYVYVAEDITERRKVSEELRRAKEAAESSNRAKSEFWPI